MLKVPLLLIIFLNITLHANCDTIKKELIQLKSEQQSTSSHIIAYLFSGGINYSNEQQKNKLLKEKIRVLKLELQKCQLNFSSNP
jgi:hypothetical protein